MRTLVLHDEAEREMREAAATYGDISSDLRVAFEQDLEDAFDRLRRHPGIGPRLDGPERKHLLTRFPFGIICRIRRSEIRILALAHHRRRPGYWSDRVSEAPPAWAA